jgi:hypothetical protein
MAFRVKMVDFYSIRLQELYFSYTFTSLTNSTDLTNIKILTFINLVNTVNLLNIVNLFYAHTYQNIWRSPLKSYREKL